VENKPTAFNSFFKQIGVLKSLLIAALETLQTDIQSVNVVFIKNVKFQNSTEFYGA
jgi:hypothetical protein